MQRYAKGTVTIRDGQNGEKSYKLQGITLTEHGWKGNKQGKWAQEKDDGSITVYAVKLDNSGELPKIICEIADFGFDWSIEE